jgi:anti-sigma regulatory factor (Ser/Thr protein kinase)
MSLRAQARAFPGTPAAIRAARAYVRTRLAGVPSGVTDAAVLAVSELATNAVEHTAEGFTVDVRRLGHGVRLAVSDSGAGTPEPHSVATSAASGRGLRIVGAIADEWGVTRDPQRHVKTVWCTIAAA